jgi:hypothetical protein
MTISNIEFAWVATQEVDVTMVAESAALISPVGLSGNQEMRKSFVYSVDDQGNMFINGVERNDLLGYKALHSVAERVLMGPPVVMLGRTVRYKYDQR